MSALNTLLSALAAWVSVSKLCLHSGVATPPSQYLCLIAQIFFKARKIFPEYLEVIEGSLVLLTSTLFIWFVFSSDKAAVCLLEWERAEISLIYDQSLVWDWMGLGLTNNKHFQALYCIVARYVLCSCAVIENEKKTYFKLLLPAL